MKQGLLLLSLVLLIMGPVPGEAEDAASYSEETPGPALGQPGPWQIESWYVFTSLYTRHFDPEPDHNNDQNLFGVEVWMYNRWLVGFSAFDNSYGQNSQYLYAGYRWKLFDSPNWYAKVTGGLLHGYKEPYEDKIPLNDWGVAPAIVPTLGFNYKAFVAEVSLAGASAVVVTAGVSF